MFLNCQICTASYDDTLGVLTNDSVETDLSKESIEAIAKVSQLPNGSRIQVVSGTFPLGLGDGMSQSLTSIGSAFANRIGPGMIFQRDGTFLKFKNVHGDVEEAISCRGIVQVGRPNRLDISIEFYATQHGPRIAYLYFPAKHEDLCDGLYRALQEIEAKSLLRGVRGFSPAHVMHRAKSAGLPVKVCEGLGDHSGDATIFIEEDSNEEFKIHFLFSHTCLESVVSIKHTALTQAINRYDWMGSYYIRFIINQRASPESSEFLDKEVELQFDTAEERQNLFYILILMEADATLWRQLVNRHRMSVQRISHILAQNNSLINV